MPGEKEKGGKLIWLDDEVCAELEHAARQGVLGNSVNNVLRAMLRLPRGVFRHPKVKSRGPSKAFHGKD